MTPPSWVLIVVAFITFVLGPITLAWYNNKLKKAEKKNKEAIEKITESQPPITYADQYLASLVNQVEKLSEENQELKLIKRKLTAEHGDLRVEFEHIKGKLTREVALLKYQFDSYKEQATEKLNTLTKKANDLRQENQQLREEIARLEIRQYD